MSRRIVSHNTVAVRGALAAALGLALIVGASAPVVAATHATASVAAAATVADRKVEVGISDVDLDGPAINPVTVTVTNSSSKAMSKVSVTFSGPVGWTVSGTQTVNSEQTLNNDRADRVSNSSGGWPHPEVIRRIASTPPAATMPKGSERATVKVSMESAKRDIRVER